MLIFPANDRFQNFCLPWFNTFQHAFKISFFLFTGYFLADREIDVNKPHFSSNWQPVLVNIFPIMQKNQEKEKRDLSTWLSYEKKETCRTFWKQKKFGQAPTVFDKKLYQFMPNNFFAFSVVALATSSTDMPFISAICSATSFT